MSSAQTISKNTTVLMVSDIFGRVLSLILIIYIARFLGDVGLGQYSFIFAFLAIFHLFTEFGLTTLMVREVARDKAKTSSYFNNILWFRLIFIIVFSVIVPPIVLRLFDNSTEMLIVILIAIIADFCKHMIIMFERLFEAHEIMEYSAIIRIVERILTVALGITVLVMGANIVGLISVFAISNFVAFVIALIITIRKVTKIRFELDFQLIKRLLKESIPFWLTSIFIMIYFQIDTVMLSIMKSYQDVGIYNAAYGILNALHFIPAAVIAAVFPAMSKFYLENKHQLRVIFKKSFYYLFAIGLPIGIGTTFLARRIIIFIYKEDFIASTLALQILIWASVIIFFSGLCGYLLNSIDKQKIFTFATGFCALLNVVLNLFLIPLYSYIGASISTVITEVALFAILFYYASKSGFSISLIKVFNKPLIAGLVMMVVLILVMKLHLLVIIPIGAIVYIVALYFLKGFGKEEIDLVKGLFTKQ